MLQVEIGEASPRVVALQILLNRSPAVSPRLVTDGAFGAKTRTAIDTFRREVMRVSGPAGVADPALWRFLLTRAGLQVVDAVDVTDPSLNETVVPEVSRWLDPIVLGGMSNGVEQLVTEVRARVRGERTLMMLRLHGHGAPGLAAVSHGSRRVSPGVDPFAAQSVIALHILPVLTPVLQRLAPLFHDFGFLELHSCRVGEGAGGASFVRKLAVAVGAPVRAAISKQAAAEVFTLTGPTTTGFPAGQSLREWGLSRAEAVKPGVPAPPAKPVAPRERPLMSTG